MNPYTFVFADYEVAADNNLLLHYTYKNQQATMTEFTERYVLPVTVDTTDPTAQYILQHLHIIVGISYYKSLLGAVELSYALTPSEADYYNSVYDNGLGEYSYLNKLTDPIRPFNASLDIEHEPVALQNHGALLGIGGGKDSAVSVEIVKAIGLETTVLDVASRDNHGQAGAVMDLTGLPQLRIERYLDTLISDFTKRHNGNSGHVPLSAILAWIGLLIAYSTDTKYVLMANESAASSGNVEWNGRIVNHQWSKSYEFEKLTQDFVHNFVSPDLWYFSPIRPYGSLLVMELFAKLGTKYYQDFTSCNLVLRIDPTARPNGRWCTNCAKCLSTWLLLSPRLSTDELVQIFGRNLFEDETLRPTLEALLGLSGHKPLDCVGTIEELRAVSREILAHGEDLPLLRDINPTDISGPDISSLVAARGPENIPSEMRDKIEDFIRTN